MLIALPNNDGSFTCTLFLPYEGEVSFSALKDEEAFARFIKQNFKDAYAHMPTIKEDFRNNPVSDLVIIHSNP